MRPRNDNILIISSYLNVPGGYEKMISSAANLFSRQGWAVTILILDYNSSTYYHIDKEVTIIQDHLTFGIDEGGTTFSRKLNLVKHIRKLKKHFATLQPGIVICTEYIFTVAAILANIHKDAKVFSWEHHHFYWLKKNRFWKFLIQKTYPKLNAVICMSEAEKSIFERFSKVIVIPNFIESLENNTSPSKHKLILSVGGLIERKGIDLLLPIAKKILLVNQGWSWKLIGDGVMKNVVLKFINENNLQGRFILEEPPGADLSKEYKNAAIFVLTSRFEAFGMVLVEAMSHSVPCVSFDCPSGPSEIIDHKVNGFLVESEDTSEMIDQIEYLIQNENIRVEMGRNAKDKSAQYSAENIYPLWEQAFTGTPKN